MTMKLIIYCLLAALIGTTALAQTHPTKKPVRKHTVIRRRVTTGVVERPQSIYCYFPHQDIKEAPTVVPFDSTNIYTYVEQMPTLNGQPFAAASRAAIEQQMVVPPAPPEGRVFVGFDISKTGSVHNARILKGLRADLDSAVVTATRQLPRFTPGKQNGHVVVVRTVVPITIPVKKQP
jgi:TonB family protein